MADATGDERIMTRPGLEEAFADEEVARVATAPNPAVAHIWEQVLREEGIPSRAVGDFLDAGIGDIPGMQAELWVRQGDLGRAQQVLEQHRARSSEEGNEDAE